MLQYSAASRLQQCRIVLIRLSLCERTMSGTYRGSEEQKSSISAINVQCRNGDGIAAMCYAAQAHFSAPSNVRRKLMSAPLSRELRTKYTVSSLSQLLPEPLPRHC